MPWIEVSKPVLGSDVYVAYRPYGLEASGEVMGCDDHELVIWSPYRDQLITIDMAYVAHIWEWSHATDEHES